jgi:hypothetical protein
LIDIRIVAEFPNSPAETFAKLTDYEKFFGGPGISCKVTRPGAGDRNGLGAVREIYALGMRFAEEITAWDAPHSYEYRVRECTLPADHQMGRMTFTAKDGGTEVVWLTLFAIPVPIVGALLSQLAAPVFKSTFRRLLRQAGAHAIL